MTDRETNSKTMNVQDQISSYIDNELSTEAEQEFLISLAASEGLRKSFRSELLMKNILHQDVASTRPPHQMRNAIFGAVGMAAGASAPAGGATTPSATSAGGLLGRIFVAAKMNVVVGSALVALSLGTGYLAHDFVQSSETTVLRSAPSHQVVAVPNTVQNPISVTKSEGASSVGLVAAQEQKVASHSHRHVSFKRTSEVAPQSEVGTPTTTLPADVKVDPTVITHPSH
jgi:hypothetical protein